MKKGIIISVALAALAVVIWAMFPENDAGTSSEREPPHQTEHRSGEGVDDETASSSDELPPPPETPANTATDKPQRLWDESVVSEGEEAGIPVTYLQAEADKLSRLAVGQTLEMPVPELGKTFRARLESTRNQHNDVRVWRGQVDGGLASENVIVTRGKQQTLVMLSTREGAYTVRIDNQSGEAAMINETHANPGLGTHEDYVVPPQWDSPPTPDPGA